MAGRLRLKQIVLHYRDEDGKQRVIKVRTDKLDAIIFSKETASVIRPHFPPGTGPDPEEPADAELMTTFTNSDTGGDGGEDDGDEGTGNCYIIDGKFICV